MTRPRLVDAYCKAGGATRGYQQAGFHVTGIDIEPQPRYVGDEFIQADALEVLADREFLSQFDAVAASPPCYDHSLLKALNNKPRTTGWMLAATRERLAASGLPFVIENVYGAPMGNPLILCGSMFGLKTRTDKHGEVWLKRHRLFESNVFLWAPGPDACYGKLTVPVYGHGAGGNRVNMRGHGVAQASREVMGIDWMTRAELDQAIPPAYTEYIGKQLLEHLAEAAA